MFIPQVDEIDVYDASGRQLEDVNSLVDFIHVSLHPQKKHHKKDTDDDNARYFHAVKIYENFFRQQIVEIKKPTLRLKNKLIYPPYLEQKPKSMCFEIQSPPPELAWLTDKKNPKTQKCFLKSIYLS